MDEIRQHTYRILRVLLQYLKRKEIRSSTVEIDELWGKIESEVISQRKVKRRKQYYLYATAAASVALLFGFGYLFLKDRAVEVDRLAQYAASTKELAQTVATDEIKLVFSDQDEMKVDNNSNIVYSQTGAVAVNANTVHQPAAKEQEEAINQIVTPKGKRTRLTLSDGSCLWINAGTRVVYPRTFEKNVREIFVEGEVYLEVAPNEKAPFFVKTNNFRVQVLGTKFNVSSYDSEPSSSVVLVEGSVRVANKSEEINLIPNQLINIQGSILDKPVTVEVDKYICWINDLLIYEDDPLPRVLRKLELYYGKEFVCKDELDHILVSGKLDLKENLDEVLHTISYSFPVSFEEKNDIIYVGAQQ